MALDAVWRRFTSVPGSIVLVVLVALAVARSGVALGRSDLRAVLIITRAFPTPVLDWRSNSVLPYGLAHLVGVTRPWQWFALHGVAIAGLVVAISACIRTRFGSVGGRRMAAVWLSIGSLPPVLLQRVGSYDPFTALGAVLVAFGGRIGLAILGGALIGMTSPEQGAVGLLAALAVLAVLTAAGGTGERPLAALRRAPRFEHLVVGLGGLVAARVLVLAWFAGQGADVPSRASLLHEYLGDSLRNAASAGGAGVYAWLGLAWGLVLVGWLVGDWRRSTVVGVVVSLVVPAAAAASVTLDGTRVFVMVSLPAFLILLGWVVDRVEDAPAVDARPARRITTALLLVAPLAPALLAEPSGATFFVFPWGR